MLKTLDGSCQTPIAGYAKLNDNDCLTLTGYVVAPGGERLYMAEETGLIKDAVNIGRIVGERLKVQAGSDLVR